MKPPTYGTRTTVETFVDGQVTNTKYTDDIRVKVENEKQVLEEFMIFRDETKDMAKATFTIERTDNGTKQGHFYVVKSLYTKP